MKKNLITIVIMALVLANLILTAIMTISIMPQTKKTNELIGKVSAAIDLDMAGGANGGAANVSMDKTEGYAIPEEMTIRLQPDANGKEHWAVIAVTLYMDTEAEGYKEYGSASELDKKVGLIKDQIISIVGKYTLDEFNNDTNNIQDEIANSINGMYGKNFIYKVAFTNKTAQ